MTYLNPLLDRLAAFEPTTLPVLSLYLKTSSDAHRHSSAGRTGNADVRLRLRPRG